MPVKTVKERAEKELKRISECLRNHESGNLRNYLDWLCECLGKDHTQQCSDERPPGNDYYGLKSKKKKFWNFWQ